MRPRTLLLRLECGLALGLFFVLVELLKAFRAWSYAGETAYEWTGLAVALAAYTAFLFLWAQGCNALLRPVARSAVDAPAWVLASVLSGALVLWALLLAHRPDRLVPDDLVIVVALLGFAGHYGVLHRFWSIPLGATCALWCVVLVAGAMGGVTWAHVLFLDVDRARDVVLLTGAWTALMGVAGTVAWVASRSSRSPLAVRGACGVVLAGISLALVPTAPRCIRPSAPSAGGPNVVLVTCDALRADFCSVYGGPVPTPALEALAERGVLFRRAYAMAPWTLPSVFSMLASDYCPPRQPDGLYVFEPSPSGTVAERLTKHGVATAAFVGNWLLGARGGALQGFDLTLVLNNYQFQRRGLFGLCPFLRDVAAAWFPARMPERPLDTSRIVTENGLAFLRRHAKGRFFLWLYYMDPHDPYDPPPRYRAMDGPWPWFNTRDWVTPENDNRSRIDLTPEEQRYARSLYEGEIRYVDECIGRVQAELERLGLLDSTYVLVVADHGEEFWDHGRYYHGQSLHEHQLRVPFIACGPDLLEGATVAQPYSLLDVTPTLADLTGLPHDPAWRGVTLAPLLRGEVGGALERPCFAYGAALWLAPEHKHCVIVGNHKLIRGQDQEHLVLFDLASDPDERHDLAPAQAHTVDQLLTRLTQWEATLPPPAPAHEAGDHEETVERLRALGYITE